MQRIPSAVVFSSVLNEPSERTASGQWYSNKVPDSSMWHVAAGFSDRVHGKAV